MKKTTAFVNAFAIIMTLLAACKKADVQQTTPPTTVPLLATFIVLDTTQTAPNDTLEIYENTYDNMHRLSDDSAYSNNRADVEVSTLSYIGSDTLFYREDDAFWNLSTLSERDASYKSYDVYGRLTKDSIIRTYLAPSSPTDVETRNFLFNGSAVIYSDTDYTASTAGTIDTFVQTINNGNIAQELNQTFNYYYTLDTHPNPLFKNKFGVSPIIDAQGGSYGYAYTEAVQKNNYLQTRAIDSSGNVFIDYHYQYTYLPNGYPSTIIKYDYSSGTPVFLFKGIYIYQ
jgi:hypothetical protein